MSAPASAERSDDAPEGPTTPLGRFALNRPRSFAALTDAEVAVVPLTLGKVALVDSDDWEWVRRFSWQAVSRRGCWYAVTNGRPPGSGRMYLHRAMLRLGPGERADHINGDGLDNRRSNLRRCTQQENSRNRGPRGSKRFKGVSFHKHRGTWHALACVNYKSVYLGFFATEEEAARAYDAFAREHYGEFAWLNFADRPDSDICRGTPVERVKCRNGAGDCARAFNCND